MTDKQIINGKECRYWFRPNPCDYRKCSLRGENDNCDEITDCFIKELLGKLALKEQECERLKHDNEYEVGALEKTIDNLREEKARYYQQTLDDEIQINELLQTLAEIKEIANYSFNRSTSEYMAKLELILEKISECGAGNDKM